MHLTFRNVNEAFTRIVDGIGNGTIPTYTCASRAGEVMMIEEPVTITYTNPRERVLFNTARDANPVFHLYESLWMLAGREDTAPLDYYSSNYSKQVQDAGSPNANGAYGNRWRNWKVPTKRQSYGYGIEEVEWHSKDQLKVIADHLRRKPESRRAVLEMWSVHSDLLRIETSKDVCCNTHVYFSVEQGVCQKCKGTGIVGGFDEYPCSVCHGKPHDQPALLNITVCNRSNDLVWGMLGANVVHFSFLQEYMARSIGLKVGKYHQFTNNLHVYTSNWKPGPWLHCMNSRDDNVVNDYRHLFLPGNVVHAAIARGEWEPVPLVNDVSKFDEEVRNFVELNMNGEHIDQHRRWKEPFLDTVAQKACHAFHMYKVGDFKSALAWADEIASEDWRIACRAWIERRQERREKHNVERANVQASPD